MRRIARTTLATAVLLAVGAGVSLADRPAQLDQLVELLDADDYQTRRNAEEALSEPAFLDTIDEDAFIELLSREDLEPEQRQRLRRVYARWFFAIEHAGMGISFGGSGVGEPMVIGTVSEDFPCHKTGLIEPYDTIIAIDGIPVEKLLARAQARWSPAEEYLRASIISREPGDTLSLTIRRAPEAFLEEVRARPQAAVVRLNNLGREIAEHPQSRTITSDVPLGSYNNLGAQSAPISLELLEVASSLRLARLGADSVQPKVILDENVEIDEWREFIRKPNRRSHNDLMNAVAGIDPGVIRKNQKYALQPVRDMRQPAVAVAVADKPLPGLDAPIVIGDPNNITESELQLIRLQQTAQREVARIEQSIEQQTRILVDRTRTDREHFLAQGRIKDLATERADVVERFKAARRALTDNEKNNGD